MNDRAVSEVVGYVLVFSLIVSTVGIVTAVGFGNLGEQQQAEQVNNVERAFDVFQNNIEDVYRDGAPSRATEMRLSGGTLRYGDPVNITVRDPANPSINHTIETTPLIYSNDGTEIVYEAGAVIRDDGHGSVMLNEPPFKFGEQYTILPLVQTTRTFGPDSISRSGTVRVKSDYKDMNTTTLMGLSDADVIEIEVESPRNDAWVQYFESKGLNSTDESSASYRFKSAHVNSPRFRIQLDYTT